MSLRMLAYGVFYWQELWEAGPKNRTATLPAILPVVFFTGPSPWRHRRDLGELIQSPEFPPAQAPRWPILYLNLVDLHVEELLRSKRAWHQALAVVRAEREEDVKEYARVLGTAAHHIDKLADTNEKRHWWLLEFILRWVAARRGREEHETLYQAAIRQVRPEHQEQIRDMSSKIRLTFEEELELKAQKRYELGKAEGRAEALHVRRTDLLRLLGKRFGPLSDELRSRIEASTDLEELRGWFDQALAVASPDELKL